MTLPIENYLAFFPATITVGMGWLRRPVRLGPLTIGRAVLLDALGVDPQRQIAEKDAALAAYVLSGGVDKRCRRTKEFDSFHCTPTPFTYTFAKL